MLRYLKQSTGTFVVIFAERHFSSLLGFLAKVFLRLLDSLERLLHSQFLKSQVELVNSDGLHFLFDHVLLKHLKAVNQVRLQVKQHYLIQFLHFQSKIATLIILQLNEAESHEFSVLSVLDFSSEDFKHIVLDHRLSLLLSHDRHSFRRKPGSHRSLRENDRVSVNLSRSEFFRLRTWVRNLRVMRTV
jgi:hypothetical protein